MVRPYLTRRVGPPWPAISEFLRIPQRRGDPPRTYIEVLEALRAASARGDHDAPPRNARPQCFGDFMNCFEIEMDRCEWINLCRSNSPSAWHPRCYNPTSPCPYVRARDCTWRFTCHRGAESEKQSLLNLKHYQQPTNQNTSA